MDSKEGVGESGSEVGVGLESGDTSGTGVAEAGVPSRNGKNRTLRIFASTTLGAQLDYTPTGHRPSPAKLRKSCQDRVDFPLS